MDRDFEILLQKILSTNSKLPDGLSDDELNRLQDKCSGINMKNVKNISEKDYIEAIYNILKLQQKKIEDLEKRLEFLNTPLLIHDEELCLEDPRRSSRI